MDGIVVTKPLSLLAHGDLLLEERQGTVRGAKVTRLERRRVPGEPSTWVRTDVWIGTGEEERRYRFGPGEQRNVLVLRRAT